MAALTSPTTATTAAATFRTSPSTNLTKTLIPFPTSCFPFKPLSLNPSAFQTLTPLQSSLSPSDHDLSSSAPTPAVSSSLSLKSRLRSGDTLYGIFLLSFSPTLAEIAALSGYDFAVVDMEHGPGGISEALHCLRALAGTQTPAILRLPESCPTWAKKALDLGPRGIMFPMIETPKMAKKAVSYCRFPPSGIRGTAHPVVRASSYGIDEGYLGNYEDELLIMCQVESEEGVKKADEIAAVDGVDCVQMGPLDLSASMGYLWDPGHKKVREAMRAAEKAVLGSDPLRRGGAFLAGFATPHDGPIELKSRGYQMVSGAVDVGLFRNAAVEDVRRFKMSLIERGGNGGDKREGGKDGDDDDEKYWSE